MSKSTEARETRRIVRERMKDVQPMKVVPSKKGLTTVYLFCAVLGYASGALVYWILKGRYGT